MEEKQFWRVYHDLAKGPELLNIEELLVHVPQGELAMLDFVKQLLVLVQPKLTEVRCNRTLQ